MSTSPGRPWEANGEEGPETAKCSARGCQQLASYDVLWNNPKIHTPDRRKHWLACAEHRDTLSQFLSARGFLRGVEPITR